MGEFDRKHAIKLIIDEWGSWHPAGTEINPRHLFEQMGTLRDALVAALSLDTFNRHADKVAMANVAQLVNNLHSLFLADGDKFVATPTYHVYTMYRPSSGRQGGASGCADARGRVPGGGKPERIVRLAGSASRKGNEPATLTLAHLHATEPAEVLIRLRGGDGRGGPPHRPHPRRAERPQHVRAAGRRDPADDVAGRPGRRAALHAAAGVGERAGDPARVMHARPASESPSGFPALGYRQFSMPDRATEREFLRLGIGACVASAGPCFFFGAGLERLVLVDRSGPLLDGPCADAPLLAVRRRIPSSRRPSGCTSARFLLFTSYW